MAEDRHYALAREAILAALTAYTGITTTDGELVIEAVIQE